MRMSTNATEYGLDSRSDTSSLSRPSWPWSAESSSKAAWVGGAAAGPSPNSAALAAVIFEGAASERRIFLKSPWIASLSSMTRIRRGDSVGVCMIHLFDGCERDLERKRGALAGAVARGGQSSADFARGVGSAVETESVAIFLRRKAVRENAREVLDRNTHAVVDHLEAQA